MAIHPKTTIANPFITKIDIPDEYFCDRETETAKLISMINNGNDIVLTADRRIGKSSLMLHLFNQEGIKGKYNTFRIDLYGTRNYQDFIKETARAILDSPAAKTQKGLKKITETIPEIKTYAKLNTGIISAGIEANLKLRYDETLDKMLKYLEKTDKPNIVVFDEFQRIDTYDDGYDMAAILRSKIQTMKNTRFVFSGSQKHMLAMMFRNPEKPFYKSAMNMELRPIPRASYVDFCKRMFEKGGKSIDDDAVDKAYSIMSGNTLDLQQAMNTLYALARAKKTATTDDLEKALEDILEEKDEQYKAVFNDRRSQKEKNLLIAIAAEGIATGITSQEFIKKYELGGSASVQATMKKLLNENDKSEQTPTIIKLDKGNFRLEDRFFELWIAKECGILKKRLNESVGLLKKEKELSDKQRPKIPGTLKI